MKGICMMKIVFSFVVFLLLSSAMFAGEKPNSIVMAPVEKQDNSIIAFTGNSTVDFFAMNKPVASSYDLLMKSFETPDEEQSPDRKNPWLAGGLSLVLPGAGEFYTKSYLKAGIFFGVEVASFILGRSYNNKGDDQTEFFQNYADAHYSAGQYAQWSWDNINVLNPSLNPANYHPINAGFPDKPPFEDVNWPELNRMEKDIANRTDGKFNGYTHQMPYYAAQQYYELIGKYDQFKTGWDDADTSYITADALPIGNRSPYQAGWYFDQRAAANRYYDIGNTYYTILIINHIVSALDAYWSATRYNSSWHAEADVQMLPTPTGMVAVPEARVRYNF
jgi:hypothetical protein